VVAVTMALTTMNAPAALAGPAGQASPGSSGIDWFEIKSRGDAFGGQSFGAIGPYEAIVAVAHGKLDPNAAANAGIVDLDKAPRTDGLVEYATDVVILRPKNPATARRVLFYDVVNRGNKLALTTYFNEGTGDLAAPDGAGNGFLMRQGLTVVFSGWQGDVPLSGDGSRVGASFPVATNPDGSAITGQSREEIVFDNTTNPGKLPLTWPAASLDPTQATLRVKEHQTDEFHDITTFSFLDSNTVQIDRPVDMDAGAIYELIYTARDPKVMGIGFAGIRDLVTFLKTAGTDARGNANPLNDLRQAPCELEDSSASCPANPTTTVDAAVIEGISQSGRFVRDYLWQGFNAGLNGGRVFDGAMPLIAASRKTWTNYRFAQPGRWSKQHEDHYQIGDQFPFTYATTTDPISGNRDGILARCTADNTCPKVIHLDGSGEFWLGRASLIVTDGAGNEVPLPDNVRAYLMTGPPHGYSATGVSGPLAACKYPSNIVYPAATARALLIDLVDWIVRGTSPPPGRYPSISAGTLVNPDSRAEVGFPDLSSISVNYTGTHNFLYLTDYLAMPPRIDASRRYQVLVPSDDRDGNELPGVRSPDVSVPLGTHMAWNPRKAGFAEGDQCTSQGSFIPFAATQDARAATGDPRLSVAERYTSRADYVARIRSAATALREDRLMLPEDVDNWVQRADAQPALQALTPAQ
ncbi:MAG TPA: alpha/beta hydrolase domain-containing protein, partial [Chloroflexota bacterium]